MDLGSGAFALAGVALGGLVAELRAWRETRSRRRETLADLRRRTYARALRRAETVASSCALWLTATDKEAASRAFWDELTAAYKSLNELRMVVADTRTAELYEALLSLYRSTVEGDQTELPDSGIHRDRLVRMLRHELGVE